MLRRVLYVLSAFTAIRHEYSRFIYTPQFHFSFLAYFYELDFSKLLRSRCHTKNINNENETNSHSLKNILVALTSMRQKNASHDQIQLHVYPTETSKLNIYLYRLQLELDLGQASLDRMYARFTHKDTYIHRPKK